MAWPTSLLTSYLPGGLPPIKAADLMAIQSAINRAFLGTYSYAGIIVDGVGGNNVAPAPGTLTTSGAVTFGGSAQIGGNIAAQGGVTCNSLRAVGAVSAGETMQVATTISAAALPTPAVVKGTLYADSCVLAFAVIGNGGALVYGLNIKSVQAFGNGVFDVTLQTPATAPGTMAPFACGFGGGSTIANPTPSSGAVIRVITYLMGQSSGNGSNQSFCLLVFGI